MTTVYLDSSAIFKLTSEERESLALIDHIAGRDVRVATSLIGEVEVVRALQRARVSRADLDQAMRGIYLLSLDEDVRREAGRLKPLALRSADAIHVASAIAIDEDDVEFITYDDRMATAARAQGLKVVQPGR